MNLSTTHPLVRQSAVMFLLNRDDAPLTLSQLYDRLRGMPDDLVCIAVQQFALYVAAA